MGVVTAATSLIDALVKKNPDEYKGCVSLAVSRLSRVIKKFYVGHSVEISKFTNYYFHSHFTSNHITWIESVKSLL